VSALRYYADFGLLPPADVDPDSGYRYFSVSQLPRLNRILALKDLGLSLDDIRRILDEDPAAAELRGMLRLKHAEIGELLAEERARLARVEARLRLIESEETMTHRDIVLETVEPHHVLCMREVVPEPQGVAGMLMDGFAALGAAGIAPIGPPFARYHDEEFTPTNIDVEVAIPVAADVTSDLQTPAGRILRCADIPGGEMAVTLHDGPYDTIDETYTAIGTWVAESAYHIAGPPQEAYLREPGAPAPPLTEIRFPVTRG
jgi:DNA-binding transcriptional MerR regulator/predicted transcriptional regulator YdeE